MRFIFKKITANLIRQKVEVLRPPSRSPAARQGFASSSQDFLFLDSRLFVEQLGLFAPSNLWETHPRLYATNWESFSLPELQVIKLESSFFLFGRAHLLFEWSFLLLGMRHCL
jgi:hypothetical protein